MGTTLSYPMPSTIAGILAGIAYRGREGCKPGSEPPPHSNPYADTEACIDALLGGGARIYTGLLVDGAGSLYAYINSGTMPLLDTSNPERCLPLKPPDKSCMEECPHIEARRHRTIGIALERRGKSVSKSMFYSLEYASYDPPASILALITGAEETPPIPSTVKLGSKTGIAIASINNHSAEAVKVGPGQYKALLIAPALLRRTPLQEGVVILSSRETSQGLARLLLEEAGLKASQAEALRVPRGEHELGVTSPGWSMALNRPRPPMLLVPPGTLLEVRLEQGAPGVRLGQRAYLVGLGCCSRLGWGTALLVPLIGHQ